MTLQWKAWDYQRYYNFVLKFSLKDFVVEKFKISNAFPQVVKAVKPNVLIGLSGCGGIFTEEVLTEVGNGSPVIINY